jgi:hypothetical protein
MIIIYTKSFNLTHNYDLQAIINILPPSKVSLVNTRT